MVTERKRNIYLCNWVKVARKIEHAVTTKVYTSNGIKISTFLKNNRGWGWCCPVPLYLFHLQKPLSKWRQRKDTSEMVNMHDKRLFVFKLRILCSSDHPILLKFRQLVLRGNCTPNQILACFVFYLKIINTFSKNDICIL